MAVAASLPPGCGLFPSSSSMIGGDVLTTTVCSDSKTTLKRRGDAVDSTLTSIIWQAVTTIDLEEERDCESHAMASSLELPLGFDTTRKVNSREFNEWVVTAKNKDDDDDDDDDEDEDEDDDDDDEDEDNEDDEADGEGEADGEDDDEDEDEEDDDEDDEDEEPDDEDEEDDEDLEEPPKKKKK